MSCGIHQNDVGTVITINIVDCDDDAIDISSAGTKQIIFKKPSGSLLTKDASFSTDGTDGKIKYVGASGDFDEIGSWKVQAYIVVGSYSWKSSFETFRVYRNLS